MLGISPDSFTLAELIPMWKAKIKNDWGQTSAIMACVLNTVSGERIALDAFVPDLDGERQTSKEEPITDPNVKRTAAEQLRKIFRG